MYFSSLPVPFYRNHVYESPDNVRFSDFFFLYLPILDSILYNESLIILLFIKLSPCVRRITRECFPFPGTALLLYPIDWTFDAYPTTLVVTTLSLSSLTVHTGRSARTRERNTSRNRGPLTEWGTFRKGGGERPLDKGVDTLLLLLWSTRQTLLSHSTWYTSYATHITYNR